VWATGGDETERFKKCVRDKDKDARHRKTREKPPDTWKEKGEAACGAFIGEQMAEKIVDVDSSIQLGLLL
jgi:hypothetical protein